MHGHVKVLLQAGLCVYVCVCSQLAPCVNIFTLLACSSVECECVWSFVRECMDVRACECECECDRHVTFVIFWASNMETIIGQAVPYKQLDPI